MISNLFLYGKFFLKYGYLFYNYQKYISITFYGVKYMYPILKMLINKKNKNDDWILI